MLRGHLHDSIQSAAMTVSWHVSVHVNDWSEANLEKCESFSFGEISHARNFSHALSLSIVQRVCGHVALPWLLPREVKGKEFSIIDGLSSTPHFASL